MSSPLIKSLAKDAIAAIRAEPEPSLVDTVKLSYPQQRLAERYKKLQKEARGISAQFQAWGLEVSDSGAVTYSYRRNDKIRAKFRASVNERIRKITALRTRALLDLLGANNSMRATITRTFAKRVDSLKGETL